MAKISRRTAPSGVAGANAMVRDLFSDGRAVVSNGPGPVVVLPAGPVPGDTIRFDPCPDSPHWTLLDASVDRVTPRCRLSGVCPGCVLQPLSAPAQARWKKEWVQSTLRRIGGLHVQDNLSIENPGRPYGYRNKGVLTFGGSPLSLGYRTGGVGGGNLLPVHHCHLLPSWMSETARAVAEFARNRGLPAWEMAGGRGWARKLVLRESAATGQRLITFLHAPGGNPAWPRETSRYLTERFSSSCTTGLLGESSRPRDTDQADRLNLLWGPGVIEEHVAGLWFRISPNSFFQVNTRAAERLVALLREWTATLHPQRIFDLYCGAGFLSLALAATGRSLTGLDANADAIADARHNAARNGINEVQFEVCDLAKPGALPDWSSGDLVIVDPPRSGLPEWMSARLFQASADALIYVSCDPASLARDLSRLCNSGVWQVEKINLLDLFPQTGHVETLVLLKRN